MTLMLRRSNRAPMPADVRAQLQRMPTHPRRPGAELEAFARLRADLAREPETDLVRTHRVVRRVFAVWTFAGGLLFAYAGVLLAGSAVPFAATGPMLIAGLLGFCAYELWPASRGVWGQVASVESASERRAPTGAAE